MKNGFLRIVGIALIAFLGRAENRPAIQALGATNSAPTSAGVAHGADPAFDFAAVSARRFPPPTPLAEATIATNFSRRFTFPHSTGGVWRLYFDYRLDHTKGRRIGGARARVSFGPKVMPWGPDVRGPMISDSDVDPGALYPWRCSMEVLPGMEFADITFELFGKGDFRVANVKFEECPPNPTPVVLELPFGGYFDGAFHIGSGQAGVPVFSWRTNLDEETPPGRFGCRIALPPGFAFVDASHADPATVAVACGTNGESVVTYRVASRPPRIGREGGEMFGVAVRADGAAGAEGTMKVVAEVDGRVASAPVSLRLVAVGPVRAGKAPARYANAAYLGGAYAEFPGEGNRALARTLCDAGVTWLLPSAAAVTNNPPLVAMWREEGMRRVTPDGSCFIANGFNSGRRVFCPCELYREDSPVRAELRGMFKKALKGCDGMWSNWEPYSHTGRRRLCRRCKEAEKGLDAKERDRLRSAEHGRVVQAVAEDVAAATDPAVGFIPGIYWPELGPGHEGFDFTREIRAQDYAKSLLFLNAFGPYVRCNTSARFVPEPGRAVAYFVVAREVMRQVEEDYPPDVRPALMAFPLGLSGMDWASRPEWLELALDSFFFNGWGCAAPWSFPSGGDARFLAAFARATELAAKWEDFVWNGARADGAAKVRPRGRVGSRPWVDRTYLAEQRDVPLIQHAVWEKGGERVVAVFNFSETASAVCDVTILKRSETVHLPPLSCRTVFFPRRF